MRLLGGRVPHGRRLGTEDRLDRTVKNKMMPPCRQLRLKWTGGGGWMDGERVMSGRRSMPVDGEVFRVGDGRRVQTQVGKMPKVDYEWMRKK